jgi:hypothetical protein
MRIVGEFAGVDRFYMFEFSGDGNIIHNTHEWCARGIEPLIEKRQNIPASKLPPFIRPIWDLEVVNIPDLSNISNNRHESKLARSLLIIPLVCNISLMGFLGFESIHEKRYGQSQ